MAQTFPDLAAFHDHGFDTVIDVRSPSEYAEDHVPGAINLPVLSDAERAEVGTMYKQISAFDARKHGAALVARNAADHIAGPLSGHGGGWKPLVYCWRGGQRSGSFTGILQQIGWRADTVQGGYQSYRRLVHRMLYDDALSLRIVLLDGYTGTAKTELLSHLENKGIQTLDLEGLANHRGSLLGGRAGGQPAQKAFESRLAAALLNLDPELPVVIEAESSKVGDLVVPPALWTLMKPAPRVEVTAPLAARAAFLTRAYADVIADTDRLTGLLDLLRGHRGHATVDRWLALLRDGDITGLAAALMEDHYDPAYARSRGTDRTVLATHHADSLDEAGLASLADRIGETVRGT